MKLQVAILFFIFPYINAADHFVSFIIPSYNCASTVEESIQSIYKQELRVPFEVICTDDGSTDTTIDILMKCQKKYQNLFVVVHEKNKGGGAARNTCVQHSRGDLIFCLDSDNVLCPKSVEKLIELIDTTGCDVASFAEGKAFYGNYNHFKSFIFYVPGHTYDIFTWLNYVQNNPAYGGNYLFTRKSYDRAGGYPEDLGAVDTHGFGVAQLVTGSVMKTVPGTYYWHRLHNDSYYVREEAKKANNVNHCKVLKNFSEVFSEKSQQILQKKDTEEIWHSFYQKQLFELANATIIKSLMKAYNYKYEKRYAEAAAEFDNAIKHGCTSQKVYAYAQQMHKLSTN